MQQSAAVSRNISDSLSPKVKKYLSLDLRQGHYDEQGKKREREREREMHEGGIRQDAQWLLEIAANSLFFMPPALPSQPR